MISPFAAPVCLPYPYRIQTQLCNLVGMSLLRSYISSCLNLFAVSFSRLSCAMHRHQNVCALIVPHEKAQSPPPTPKRNEPHLTLPYLTPDSAFDRCVYIYLNVSAYRFDQSINPPLLFTPSPPLHLPPYLSPDSRYSPDFSYSIPPPPPYKTPQYISQCDFSCFMAIVVEIHDRHHSILPNSDISLETTRSMHLVLPSPHPHR